MSDKTQRRITFGYNREPVNQIEINKAQAITLKLLFEYYAEGLSIRAIADKLEAHGIPSPYNNSNMGHSGACQYSVL